MRISLVSEEDTTPREHEADHKRLIRALIPEVCFEENPEARIAVEREIDERPAAPSCGCGEDDYQVIDLD
jgi:hypothetical protein